jgi:hypothetical protein
LGQPRERGRHERRQRGQARGMEARELVREVSKEAMAGDRRGRDLRRRETVRAIVSEEMAWALLYGVEPRLSLDEEANFYTITGFRALHSNDSANYPSLFGSTPLPAA